MRIQQFFVEGLGHQSYLVTDEASHTAAVVDPRRDVEIYLDAAAQSGARITHVFETHIHNDYITGARELADRVGATIVSSASAHLAYEHQGVREGDRVAVGSLAFAVLETPGHTPDHLSYAVYEPERGVPSAVFSGGSMLVGNAGRTDLVSPGMMLTLTREQYRSLRRLIETFPADVRVYPTHGAGSFCGSTSATPSTRYTTIGQERLASPAAHARDEADFVRRQLAGYGVYPRYYAHMGEINQRGPRLLGGLPALAPLAPLAIRERMTHGIPLIDSRARDAFAREHVPGSLNIELDASFGTYVGWILPFNKPLALLVEGDDGRREAATQLLRIGYEQLEGYLDGGIAAWKAAEFPTGSFTAIDTNELHSRWMAHEPLAILDVRDEREWQSGHIPGAQHIHIGDLMAHLNELPLDRPVATICRTGHRAAIAASIVAALGRPTIAIQRGGVSDWLANNWPAELPALSAAPETEHAHL
jgi:hydroxyacylglutathione hydrolase